MIFMWEVRKMSRATFWEAFGKGFLVSHPKCSGDLRGGMNRVVLVE